jgi:glucosamine-6-phosphate deaminase
MPKQGYSMGIGTIMEAKQLVLMASGKEKAQIIAKAICGPITKDLPASIIQKHKDVIVILDREAAKELEICE